MRSRLPSVPCRPLVLACLALGLAPAARAGDVSIKQKGSTLVIKGSDGADQITIGPLTEGPGNGGGPGGTLDIAPSAKGTTLNGSPDPLSFDGIVNLKLAMGDGPDDVALVNLNLAGTVKANGNAGNDSFTIDSSNIDGDVKIVSSTGTLALVVLDSNLGRDLVVKGGNDPDLLDLHASNVSRNFKAVLLSGADMVSTETSDFDGISIKGGLDANTMLFRSGSTGSQFTYAGGSGDDDVTLEDMQVGETANFKLGPGNNLLTVRALASFMQVGESLVIKGGPQDDTIVFEDPGGTGFPNTQVGEGTKLSLAKGNNSLSSEGRLQSFGLTYSGGGNDDTADCTGLDSGGDVRFALAAGTNSVLLTDCDLGEDLFVTAGSGDDSLELAGTTTVSGKQKISLGGGSNSITVP